MISGIRSTDIKNNMTQQLFVDISELVRNDRKTGIQRVVRSILLQLLKQPPKGYLVIPVYSQFGEMFKCATSFTCEVLGEESSVEDDLPINYSYGDVFLGLDLTFFLFPMINNTLETMREQRVKINYVVYDLTPLLHPEWHEEETNAAFVHWIDSLTQYADGLICISKSVVMDVNEWLEKNRPYQKDRLELDFFHLGADFHNSIPILGMPVDAGLVLESIKNRSSFLSVATIEPRKGFSQLLAAFEVLWYEGYDINLIIVGHAGWKTEGLIENLRNHSELNQRLFWLEGISDEYLDKIYAASSCLVAASENEGFGLPLIEAAQHKLSIIARDIPVFREVAGEYAYYFTGLSGEMLATSIKKWMLLKEQDQVPSSVNMPWLTWAESTNQLIETLSNMINKGHLTLRG